MNMAVGPQHTAPAKLPLGTRRCSDVERVPSGGLRYSYLTIDEATYSDPRRHYPVLVRLSRKGKEKQSETEIDLVTCLVVNQVVFLFLFWVAF